MIKNPIFCLLFEKKSCAANSNTNFNTPDVLGYYYSTEYELRCYEYSTTTTTTTRVSAKNGSSYDLGDELGDRRHDHQNQQENETTSYISSFIDDTTTKKKKKCSSTNFVFDKTYYRTTLTEEVSPSTTMWTTSWRDISSIKLILILDYESGVWSVIRRYGAQLCKLSISWASCSDRLYLE